MYMLDVEILWKNLYHLCKLQVWEAHNLKDNQKEMPKQAKIVGNYKLQKQPKVQDNVLKGKNTKANVIIKGGGYVIS